MINFLNKNDPLSEHKSSLNITYPRTVNIIFGNYPYPDQIHNFILQIKSNLDPKMKNYTNVKGGMTDWNYFIDKPDFINFITFLINKHQIILVLPLRTSKQNEFALHIPIAIKQDLLIKLFSF